MKLPLPTRKLPKHPALDQLKRQAKELFAAYQAGEGTAAAVREFMEQAVTLNPLNAEALNSLSVAYAAAGDVEKALATIDRALKLNPSDALQKLLRQRRDLLTRQR